MATENSDTTHFFTVDVEEYFQVGAFEGIVPRDAWSNIPSRVGRSIDLLLERMDRHGAKGTFFVLGWLARYRPEVVRSIADAGHEIASHGFGHDRVTRLRPSAFREDVRSAKSELEDLIAGPVVGYRAPNFSITPGFEWAFDVLIEEGYQYDSSIFPIRRPGYGYPSAPRVPYVVARPAGRIAEFPLATTNLLAVQVPAAGGAYLRQFPLGVIRRAFRKANQRGESQTFYIHPWEIDADQPRLPVSALTSIRHYRGLSTALGRIESLLSEFHFDRISSALPRISTMESTHWVVA